MNRPLKITGMILAFPIAAFLLVSVTWALSSGPLDSLAADPPGFNDCTQCHNSFSLNQGTGTLELTGLPQAYTPDMTYPLTVTLTDIGQARWGFELTAILETWNQGGILDTVNANVQLSEGPGNVRDYLKHTSAGTFNGQDSSATWNIEWTAPPPQYGHVFFYLTGNAANGNGGPDGDYIYAISDTVSEGQVGVLPTTGQQPISHLLVEAYPNPFNPVTEFTFSLPASSDVGLVIYDTSGNLITNLVDGFKTAGVHTARFDASSLASGLYIYRLTAGDLTSAGKIVLLK